MILGLSALLLLLNAATLQHKNKYGNVFIQWFIYTCISEYTYTHRLAHAGPCLDKLELSMLWVREGRGELATGVCSAFSLNASDRACLKNDMVLKWKSRAAGTMCCFKYWAGGRSEGRTCKSRTACFWMWYMDVTFHNSSSSCSTLTKTNRGREGARAPMSSSILTALFILP